MRAALPAGPVAAGFTARRPMPRPDAPEPCGGETVIDLALCLILAFAVVGLLLLAL